MKSKDIRNSFIDYFKDRGHTFVRSSPSVPINDPSLLFTNAGMNQFKPVFLDDVKPDTPRAVNSQKCIRVSGKHNDLEEVGVDTFHHTFFEMLGNWSFGNYYKKEAISWAWELFTDVWKLDKNRLWATVFVDDDEAYNLWARYTDIGPDRIVRCGKKDNFWEMGETGPCGPCSEIHYYIGSDIDKQSRDGVNKSEEYWELWNLVFIQNNRKKDGSLEELPQKHVDTGAGLERIAAVLQNKTSNYDTDLFVPIIDKIESITSDNYKTNPIPFRVIADHIRMLSFSIGDGALPSNEGRGYVIRRILRRGSRFGRTIGLEEPFLFTLVDSLIEVMGEIYPELVDKSPHIKKVIKAEEELFNKTLDRGLSHLEKIILEVDNNIIRGTEAFKLYDTYGFPLDLTQLIARERNISVDEKGFDEMMKKQKQKAKASSHFQISDDELNWTIHTQGTDSEFVGYNFSCCKSKLRKHTFKNDQVFIVLDKTPFYAESGGQIFDTGMITGDGINLEVVDVQKINETIVHICKGSFKENDIVFCEINEKRRGAIRKNHTATHLMHRALKDILGDHVNQAGSLVHPDYLRFDLTHPDKITKDQVMKLEQEVNKQILLNKKLEVSIQNFDEAKQSGAEALFGEKYGEEVRVVNTGDYSVELCGGTHVNRTGEIGSFKIVEESSLSSGVRRIVALTGEASLKEMQKNDSILNALQKVLHTPPDLMEERISGLLKEKKHLEKKIKSEGSDINFTNLLSEAEHINNWTMILKKIKNTSKDGLKIIGDKMANRMENGVCVLFSEGEEKPNALVVVSKSLIDSGILAGDLAKNVGEFMGGGGGGKPHLATAGGRDNIVIDNALKKSENFITNLLREI